MAVCVYFQAEGMIKACVGSMDKSPPKEIMWKTFPHRLLFGRETSMFWGVGGVAYTNPLTNLNDQTHMCLYRITLSFFISVSEFSLFIYLIFSTYSLYGCCFRDQA